MYQRQINYLTSEGSKQLFGNKGMVGLPVYAHWNESNDVMIDVYDIDNARIGVCTSIACVTPKKPDSLLIEQAKSNYKAR